MVVGLELLGATSIIPNSHTTSSFQAQFQTSALQLRPQKPIINLPHKPDTPPLSGERYASAQTDIGPGRRRHTRGRDYRLAPEQTIAQPPARTAVPIGAQQPQQPPLPSIPLYINVPPPPPATLHLPPEFDSLMEILRETRLAQLATVDQQRELMRYMRGLNVWLEQDVHERQTEIRGVVSRVEQLSHDLRGLQMQGHEHRTPSSSSSPTNDQGTYQFATWQGPHFPPPYTGGMPPTFQPFEPVIPPVIPDDVNETLPSNYPPVLPQHIF